MKCYGQHPLLVFQIISCNNIFKRYFYVNREKMKQ